MIAAKHCLFRMLATFANVLAATASSSSTTRRHRRGGNNSCRHYFWTKKEAFIFRICDLLSINPKKDIALFYLILFVVWTAVFKKFNCCYFVFGLTSFIYQKWSALFINDFAQFDVSLSFNIEKISFDTC